MAASNTTQEQGPDAGALTREQLLALARSAPEVLVDLMLAMQEQIRVLTLKVAELEARLAQNSRNSHRPPGSDGLGKAPAPKSLRVKSGRRPGGQPGHPGHTLRQVETPEHTLVHAVEACPCGQCGGVSLAGEPLLGYEARQVFDLPPRRLEVTEHRAEIKRCPVSGRQVCAAFPTGVSAAAQYGVRFQSLLVYLHTAQLLPFARISQLCGDLFGAPVGAGTLAALNASLAHSLAGHEAAVVAALQKAEVLHCDESGVRVAGKLHWLHTAGTGELTFYHVHAKRGTEAMEAAGILPHFKGWAVHDFWSPYLRYQECLHAFCNAHLLRELKFLLEEEHLPWAGQLMELLGEFQALKKARPRLSEGLIEKCQRRYHALLKAARRRHPRPAVNAARAKQSKAANLLARLEDYDQCILAFLSVPAVPFTNNQAEQDIRMIKVRQKISGCFRTLEGARVFATIRGFLSTARKQGKDLLEALTQAFSSTSPIFAA